MIEMNKPVASLLDEDGAIQETTTGYEVKEGDQAYPFVMWFTFPCVPEGEIRHALVVHIPIDGVADTKHICTGMPFTGNGGRVRVSLPLRMYGRPTE